MIAAEAVALLIGESNKPVRKGRVLKRLFKRPSTKQGHLKLFERELSELCEQNAAIPFPVMVQKAYCFIFVVAFHYVYCFHILS